MIRPPPRSTLFPSPPLFRSILPASTAASCRRGADFDFLPRCITPDQIANAGDLEHFLARKLKRFRILSREKLQWKYAHTHQVRSEEHTSELQSQSNLVCRLL